MAYGSFGPGGFTQAGSLAQALSGAPGGLASLPRTITPPMPPGDPESVENRSAPSSANDLARLLMGERDSQSKGSELSRGMSTGTGFGNSDFISAEPGSFGLMGLSTGTAYDKLGQGYDTANLDLGALAGGLVGGLAGPIGGLAGGLAGRQLDANVVLDASRNRTLDFGQGGVGGMSRGERRAFQEARQAVMNRPMPQNLTSTERALREASQRQSQSRPSETTWGSSSAGGSGRQSVSGATRNSGFGGREFGDRGRSVR